MKKFQLFGEDEKYEYQSPTKDPMNIANPEYKPFGSNYSSCFSEDEGAKSEDDSPKRRKMLKSPTRKNPKVLGDDEHKKKMEEMQKLLNETDMLDKRLRNQIKYV
jgi:hypothetical protein